MKYRAIIADDEWMIIQLIRQLGHWEELDIEIVDECQTGEDALQSILKNRPDFVLSDIKMPGYDGIELIEKVREQDQRVLFILLSGYRYFEYARSAVRLNVVDYLLKPVDEQQLNEILEKTCRNIDQIRQQETNRQQLETLQTADLANKQSGFWNRFLDFREENRNAEQLLNREDFSERYGMELPAPCFQVLCIETNLLGILDKDNSVFIEKVSGCVAKAFRELAHFTIHADCRGIVVILNFAPEQAEPVMKAVSTLFYSIRDMNELYGEFRLSIGCGEMTEDVKKLQTAMEQAVLASWGRLIFVGNQVIRYERLRALPSFDPKQVVTDAQMREIAECIKIFHPEELGQIFAEVYKNAARFNHSSVADMLTTYMSLLDAILKAIPEEKREEAKEHLFLTVQNAISFQQIFKKIYDYLSQYIEEERKQLDVKLGKPVEDTIRYMKRNYKDGLSLEDAAAAVNVSASYLSRIFKEKTGSGFNEYLTQIRLEESQRLLRETNLSVKEIAMQVGYLDEKYYSKLFKKITGIKPTDYRRLYG